MKAKVAEEMTKEQIAKARLWREKAQRGNKNLVDAVKRCDGRSSNPGRPRKWKEGEQVRLMTRVRPNTLLWLKSQSKDANESIGQIIDRLVEPKE